MRKGGIVAITGGSSGIGRAVAVLFARRGWRVGLIARGKVGLHAARREIEEFDGTVTTAQADVANDADTERAATEIEERLGPIDVWVNSAGNGVFGRFLDVTDAEFRRVTDVTYLGTVNGTRAALKRMRPRNEGVVVNVCSGVAFHGMPLLSSYSGAKYAVRGFADAVRSELLQEGSRVRITTVFPPAVNTPFFAHAATHLEHPPRPAKPVYQPEVVAEAILLAATRPRREIEISGVTSLFAFANKLSPALMDRVIRRLGYEGQTTSDHRAALSRDPTLFRPSDRPSGARGAFDDEARTFSVKSWVGRNRLRLGLAAAALFLIARRR